MMIYKDPGNPKIHRLRVIHLYEADLNFILGLKWRQVVWKAIKADRFNHGQCGGLPGRNATDLPLFEELSSLAGRRFGLHTNGAKLHAAILSRARYHLKTRHGVTESYYRHAAHSPIYGTGQGTGNSPAIWGFLSSILFDAHSSRAHGMTFVHPDFDDCNLDSSMVGFVDDSTTLTGFDRPATVAELLSAMTSDAQLWHDLLHVSGGALALEKCSFHVLHCEFDQDGVPQFSILTNPRVALTSPDGGSVTIPHNSVYKAHKTLGHYKAPLGENTAQFDALLQKALSLSQALRTSRPERYQAQIFYTTIFRPAVEYVLGQSFLTRSQLDNIQRRSFPTIFSSCGFNSRTSHALLFGPRRLGGGGFIPLYCSSRAKMITHFLKFYRSPDTLVGKLLHINLAWAQFQAGVSYPILLQPSTPIPWLPGNYFPAIRQYLTEIHASIEIRADYDSVPPPLRAGDVALMALAVACNLTSSELRVFNCCRLYFNVVYLSEICTVLGSIPMDVLRGKPSGMHYRPSRYPLNQARPSNWRVWRRVLTSDLTKSRIGHSLGSWTPDHSRHGCWKAYRQTGVDRALVMDSSGSTIVCRVVNHRFLSPISQDTSQPSSDHYPIHLVTKIGPMYLFRDRYDNVHDRLPTQFRPQDPDPWQHFPTRWEALVRSGPPWERLLIQDVTGYDYSIEALPVIIRKQRSLIAVSDASAPTNRMGWAWILATEDEVRLAQCSGPGWGTCNSFCAESTGLLSLSCFIHRLYRHFRLRCPIKIYCDNKALVTRCQQRRNYKESFPNHTLIPEYDLTEQIHGNLSIYPVTFYHVKGHQDDFAAKTDLAFPAKLNVECDKAAGAYCRTPASSYRPRVPVFLASMVQLHIRGTTVTSDYFYRLIAAFTEPEYIHYMQTRFKWSTWTTCDISWGYIKAAVSEYHVWATVSKVCNHRLAHHDFLHKISHSPTPLCVVCDETETMNHLFQCSHPSRLKWRARFLADLRDTLCDEKTPLPVRTVLVTAVRSWLSTSFIDIDSFPPEFHSVLSGQSQIGWQHFLTGKLSRQWSCILVKFSNANYDVDKWGRYLVKFLVRSAMNLWETRNQAKYGATLKDQAEARRATVFDKIRSFIHAARLLPHIPLDFIPADVDRFLQSHPTEYLVQWLSLYRPLLTSASLPITPITHYFPITQADSSFTSQPPLDGTLHDPPYCKARDRRPTFRQTTLAAYFST